jgi:hypothetical protein
MKWVEGVRFLYHSTRKLHLANLNINPKMRKRLQSTTQPSPERRHARSNDDCANDDENAHDNNEPRRGTSEYPRWDHYGQD